MDRAQASQSPLRHLLVALAALAALAGCDRDRAAGTPGSGASTDPVELTVFAASSLREAFEELGAAYEAAHPDVDVMFSVAGSQELRTQVEKGAPADVIATADAQHMEALVTAKRVTGSQVLARNEPVVVTTPAMAATVVDFATLGAAPRIVVGAAEVPIGRYTLQILDRASAKLGAGFRSGVEARIVSREFNVRQVLGRVERGEADAAIVYRTDALSAPGVRVVPIPPDLGGFSELRIATVSASKHPVEAARWVEFALSPAGREVLDRAGFLPP
jgi:molybdate transport system substrate-binding protein